MSLCTQMNEDCLGNDERALFISQNKVRSVYYLRIKFRCSDVYKVMICHPPETNVAMFVCPSVSISFEKETLA